LNFHKINYTNTLAEILFHYSVSQSKRKNSVLWEGEYVVWHTNISEDPAACLPIFGIDEKAKSGKNGTDIERPESGTEGLQTNNIKMNSVQFCYIHAFK
jgi:hypothetical protein